MTLRPRRFGTAARLLVVVLLTGAGAGLGGIALTLLLHLVQHLAYGHTEDTFLRGVEQASVVRRVLVMTVGGAAVGIGWWLLGSLRPRQPSVADGVQEPGRLARLPVSTLDAGLQIVAVGLGASLGREGAPRQVGAALGSWLAGRARLTPAQRSTVVACGAGAGLAAVYNVPLSGALFTLEVLLRSARPRHVVPAALSSAVATAVALLLLPDAPTYDATGLAVTGPLLLFAVLIGPVAAGAGAMFLQVMAAAGAHRPGTGRLPVTVPGAFAIVGALAAGYPELLGNGKGLTQIALTGRPALLLLAAVLVLKPLATALCLSSGANGGLLTPALATGAVLGALSGRGWELLLPGTAPGGYALVTATAVLATTQRAPLTALALGLELTHATGALLVPMALATAVAYGCTALWRASRSREPGGWSGRRDQLNRGG